jgi:hypothetical protein
MPIVGEELMLLKLTAGAQSQMFRAEKANFELSTAQNKKSFWLLLSHPGLI